MHHLTTIKDHNMKPSHAEKGSVLIGILWCVALLSVVVVGVLYTSRIDLTATKLHGDRIQAYYLALAGAETAKALIYEDSQDRGDRNTHHTGALYEDASQFQDINFSRGTFRVGHGERQNQDGTWTFGVRDEDGKLNINTASKEELAKLPGSSESIRSSSMLLNGPFLGRYGGVNAA